MSTRCAGAASRMLSSGSSDWPPASTFPSGAAAARSARASATDSGREYPNWGGFTGGGSSRGPGRLRRPLCRTAGPRPAASRCSRSRSWRHLRWLGRPRSVPPSPLAPEDADAVIAGDHDKCSCRDANDRERAGEVDRQVIDSGDDPGSERRKVLVLSSGPARLIEPGESHERTLDRVANVINDPKGGLRLPIRAVVLDIGGVLERVDDYESVLSAAWRERLGMSADAFMAALAAIDPAGLSETGQMSESEWADRCATCLGLSPGQQQEFVADVWDWYCGELDAELMAFAAALRPGVQRAIISNSADGARREELARYAFDEIFDPIIYSHEVGLAKPDPAIFELAASLLGR